MKNWLLPTDLSVASLCAVSAALRADQSGPVRIHLVHLLNMPGSIGDLFSARFDKPYRRVPADFMEAVELLQQRFAAQGAVIQYRFLYGNTGRYLRNFIEANDIDVAWLLSDYIYQKPFENSADTVACVKATKLPVTCVRIAAASGTGTGAHGLYTLLQGISA